MNPIQGHSPIWHDMSGIDRLSAQVKANDDRRRAERRAAIAIQQEQVTMSMTNDPYLLGNNLPVVMSRRMSCIKGFGHNDCEHPACVCGAMPIKSSGFDASHSTRHELLTQEEHAEHLEANRDPRTPASFRRLAVMCLGTAMFTIVAIVSSPFLMGRAVEVLKSWF